MSKESNNIISALCWVKRGYAAPVLQEYEPTKQEILKHKMMSKKLAKGQDISKMEISEAVKVVEQNMDQMNLDEDKSEDYEDLDSGEEVIDDIDDDENGGSMPIFTPELGKMKRNALKQQKERQKKKDQKVDVQIEDKEMEDDGDEDFIDNNADVADDFSDSEEDKEDFTIRKSDSIIVSATAENDHSNLEVYVYDHKTSDLYVHHEIILGAYPLCLEWLNTWQGQKTNHIIVGTFLPEIEIWNLDSENTEPTAILGSVLKSEEHKAKNKSLVTKFKKKDKKQAVQESEQDLGTHTDAVMCLHLNPIQKEYLASGSEDSTVRIWDLDDLQCKQTIRLHKSKVQSVRWNSKNDNTLLSAGYDRSVYVMDVRDQASYAKTKIPSSAGDIESANWHPTMEHNFAVSTESGQVFGFDSRKIKEPVFTVQAHEQSCSQVQFSPHIPNMMATSGTEGIVKIWDITGKAQGSTEASNQPVDLATKTMKQGELFAMQFCQDIPWVLATGGSTGQMAIWDISENRQIENHFKGNLIPGSYSLGDYDPNAPVVEVEVDQYSEGADDLEDKDDSDGEDQIQEVTQKKKKRSNKQNKLKEEKKKEKEKKEKEKKV